MSRTLKWKTLTVYCSWITVPLYQCFPIKNRRLKFHKCFQNGVHSGVTQAPKGFNGKGERKCLQPDTQHHVQQIFGPLPRVTIVCALQLHTSISTQSALCTLTTQRSECSFMSANISNKKCIDRHVCVRYAMLQGAHTTCRGWHRCWDHHISLQNYTCSYTTIMSTFNSQAKGLCSTLTYLPLFVVYDSLEEILVYSTDNNSNWN